MTLTEILPLKISIFQGWGIDQPIAETPDWTGTVEEYWEKNADAVTLASIRDMIDDLEAGHHHALGGGGMGCFTIRYAGNDAAADDEDEPLSRCTSPTGHEFECTGTAYGGDDERWHGEGRCLCIYCGADGDG